MRSRVPVSTSPFDGVKRAVQGRTDSKATTRLRARHPQRLWPTTIIGRSRYGPRSSSGWRRSTQKQSFQQTNRGFIATSNHAAKSTDGKPDYDLAVFPGIPVTSPGAAARECRGNHKVVGAILIAENRAGRTPSCWWRCPRTTLTSSTATRSPMVHPARKKETTAPPERETTDFTGKHSCT